MPARTDHDRRDAQDAARAEIRVAMNRYIRRVYEGALAHIEERATSHDGITPIDWVYEGKVAAHSSLHSWGIDPPVATIEAHAPGADPEIEPTHP